MAGLLQNRVALVTGAGSGIGRAIAIGYAREGARVMAADVNDTGTRETVAEIEKAGGTGRAWHLDVRDANACNDLRGEIHAAFGHVSILVNNAGIVRRNPVTHPDMRQDWTDILAVNLDGVFNVTMAFLDDLRETKGAIVNLGSIQSFIHTPNSVAYTTTKGAVRSFTLSMAAELGADGVRVNAIGPGLIRTPLNETGIQKNPELLAKFMSHTPLARAGTPEDIVGPAIFLASDMARYVTGVTLPVDGGYLTV